MLLWAATLVVCSGPSGSLEVAENCDSSEDLDWSGAPENYGVGLLLGLLPVPGSYHMGLLLDVLRLLGVPENCRGVCFHMTMLSCWGSLKIKWGSGCSLILGYWGCL